ncbi:DNA internalization-related competence protein ComEC/Rec2 [Rhodocyclaceae bacterium SMB388]
MSMPIIGFACGVAAMQMLPALPGRPLLLGGTILLLVTLLAIGSIAGTTRDARVGAGYRIAIVLIAVVSGFAWSAWRAQWRLADALPMQWESRDLEVTGVISGLPRYLERSVRFELLVDAATAPVPRRIQLSWYLPRRADAPVLPNLRPGERWRLTVRLKRPHGLVNPHGFDYEAWLLERNIRATGYVREHGENRRLAAFVLAPMNLVHRARDAIRGRFADTLADEEHAGIPIALAIGDQRAIPAAHWEVFRRTAVAHLVSISGLHVSLVAVLAGGLVGAVWRRVPRLALAMPTQKAAILAGLLFATVYALLAGLGLPTLRALIMLAVAGFAILSGREARPGRVLALALLGVLVLDPWAVLSAGFWLSFGAVGVIIFVMSGRLGRPSAWATAVRIQLAITFATVPALLVLFNAFSLVAPFANALAIPMVSFVIAPLSLLAIVVPAPAVLHIAHWVTEWMMRWLDWLAASPHAMWQQAAQPPLLTLCAVVAVAWLLLPRGQPARHVAMLAMLPLLWWSPPRPELGQFRVVALDVGHGLAVHVQTATHDLLFDAGPSFGRSADAGGRVLLPYFVATGVSRLHKLVISHGDGDHAGGAATLLAGMPVSRLMTTPAEDHAALAAAAEDAVSCVAGRDWAWDGVRFEVLHPSRDTPPFRKPNDNSCVIRISTAAGSVLLAGDIESPAEQALVARWGPALASDVVLVPHHGSRSSSTAPFVAAVSARHAIHVVGNLNPFRHPHPEVWARWAVAGARNWRTDAQGAITVDVGEGGLKVASQRTRAPRYWHGR